MPGAAAIARILDACDLAALEERTGQLRALADALAAIEKVTQEGAGYEYGVKYPNLRPLAARIRDFLQGVLARRDPNAAPPETEPAEERPPRGGAGGAGPRPAQSRESSPISPRPRRRSPRRTAIS